MARRFFSIPDWRSRAVVTRRRERRTGWFRNFRTRSRPTIKDLTCEKEAGRKQEMGQDKAIHGRGSFLVRGRLRNRFSSAHSGSGGIDPDGGEANLGNLRQLPCPACGGP